MLQVVSVKSYEPWFSLSLERDNSNEIRHGLARALLDIIMARTCVCLVTYFLGPIVKN